MTLITTPNPIVIYRLIIFKTIFEEFKEPTLPPIASRCLL